MAQLYLRDVDPRFAPSSRTFSGGAGLGPGDRVIDLGTGTGSVAIGAPPLVGPAGTVTAVDLPDFELAGEVLAGVTTARLPSEAMREAQAAVQAVMWRDGQGPRHLRNVTRFLVGHVP